MNLVKGTPRRLAVCVFTAAACALAAACVSGSPVGSSGAALGPAGRSGPELVLTAVPGPLWTTRKFFLRMTPSFAGWVETDGGEYAGTLVVSGKASEGGWIGAPGEGRPESLPVWFNASGASAAAGDDAVSGASSASGAVGSNPALSLIPGQAYWAYFEINRSFDYNDAWPKEGKKGGPRGTGVNGQPSLVYGARFIAGEARRIDLALLGHGSVDGSDGLVDKDFSGITTALEVVNEVYLEVY